MDQTDVQVWRSDHDHRSSSKSWHACGVAESAEARDCEREGSVESRRNSKRHRLTRTIQMRNSILAAAGALFSTYSLPAQTPFDPHDLSGTWTRSNRVLTMSNETPPMTAF